MFLRIADQFKRTPVPTFIKIRVAFLLHFILFGFVCLAQNKKYFVSNTGNDLNDGQSIHTPWKSIDKVNQSTFLPGDIVHFKSNETFPGKIRINEKHSGTKDAPIVIKSYGNGKAIIHGGFDNAIEVRDVEYFEIRDLEVAGNGRYNNEGSGIHIMTGRTDKMLFGVVIDNVNVHGFYWSGIGVGAEPTTQKGFENLRITNCNVYENGFAGIQTWGAWDDVAGKSAFSHKGLYIAYTKAYNNHGINTYTFNWSGTGILMAGVENGLIEYCEAFDNGKENGCSGGGPVGIWLANAKGCIIQFCESYSNKAGKRKDGGGFDIDGGSQYCIIQYCYSHDNEGPGYAMFEWGNKIRYTNNIIRYNISQNDARKNGYGAISFWSNDSKLYNCEVYNNTIYLSDSSIVSGTPSAIKFSNKSMSNLKIRNNIFYVTKGVSMLNAPLFDTTVALFQNNNYYSTINRPTFYFGSYFYSLSEWKAGAAGQEMKGNKSIGFSKDPLFINPGGGKSIKPTHGGDLTYMTAYMIQPTSEMIDAGLNLNEEFGIDIGSRDFYNNKVLEGSNFDIGANEFNPLKFIVMPLQYLSFTVQSVKEKLVFHWKVNNSENIQNFVLQTSGNGIHFEDAFVYQLDKKIPDLTYQTAINAINSPTNYCRIKSVEKNGNITYSTIVKVQSTEKITPVVFPIPTSGSLNILLPLNKKYNRFLIKDVLNKTLMVQEIKNNETLIKMDMNLLTKGIYFIEIYQSNLKSETLKFIVN